MITSQLAEPSVSPLREQKPRIYCAPPYAYSTGPEAIDLASMAGLELDEWQREHLTAALGEKRDGRWAAFEVGEVVPRQNGKNGELEARQLTGMFILEELLQIHSAHMADTSVEQFLRVSSLIEATPELSRRVKKMTRGKGTESIQLHRNPKTGRAPRLTFRTRTGGGGRGFSCDTLYFDEAMILPESFHGALMPTLSARPNPQVYYTASAVDKEVHEDGIVLSRLRSRALAGGDPSLVYWEFSVDAENPDQVTAAMATDPERWAEANPALGIRITEDYIAKEQRSMSTRTFAVERLNVGDWPDPDGMAGRPISPEAWAALADMDSAPNDPVCFAVDVSPDRARAAIGVAGFRQDGKPHVEVIEHKRQTGWVVETAKSVLAKNRSVGIVLDATGQGAALLPEFQKAGIELRDDTTGRGDLILVNASEHAQACGIIYDAVEQDMLAHLGTPELQSAIAGAVKRPLGDRWAWSRKDSTVDISPLVTVTLALWGLQTFGKPGEPQVIDLNKIAEDMRAEAANSEEGS